MSCPGVPQLIATADILLQPEASVFGDISGAPVQSTPQQSTPNLHSQALLSFDQLTTGLHCLETVTLPPEPDKSAERASIFIEELSAREASSQGAATDQQTLFGKACLAVALYAADTPLLSPWTSHQLDLASNKLMVALENSVWRFNGVRDAKNDPCASPSVPCNAQDLITSLMPSLLSMLMPNFKRQDNYNKVQLSSTEGQ